MFKVAAPNYPYLLNSSGVFLAHNPNAEEGVSPYAFVNTSILGVAALFATKEEAEAAVATRNEFWADKTDCGKIVYVEVEE